VGEINAREQIEFSCSHCGWRVSMEHDGSKASAARFERRAIPNLDSTRGGRSPGARSSRPMRNLQSKVCCPACKNRVMLKMGEIDAHGQIECLCLACGWRGGMDQYGSEATATRSKTRSIFRLNFKKRG
jgi:hypothetical protein